MNLNPKAQARQVKTHLANFTAALSLEVAVGILKEDATRGLYNGLNVAEIGAVHDRTRSWLHMPLNREKTAIRRMLNRQLRLMVQGKASPSVAIGRVGVFCENVIGEAFATGGWGLWAKLTGGYLAYKLRKGGSPMILIDSGILRSSVASAVRRKSGR